MLCKLLLVDAVDVVVLSQLELAVFDHHLHTNDTGLDLNRALDKDLSIRAHISSARSKAGMTC